MSFLYLLVKANKKNRMNILVTDYNLLGKKESEKCSLCMQSNQKSKIVKTFYKGQKVRYCNDINTWKQGVVDSLCPLTIKGQNQRKTPYIFLSPHLYKYVEPLSIPDLDIRKIEFFCGHRFHWECIANYIKYLYVDCQKMIKLELDKNKLGTECDPYLTGETFISDVFSQKNFISLQKLGKIRKCPMCNYGPIIDEDNKCKNCHFFSLLHEDWNVWNPKIDTLNLIRCPFGCGKCQIIPQEIPRLKIMYIQAHKKLNDLITDCLIGGHVVHLLCILQIFQNERNYNKEYKIQKNTNSLFIDTLQKVPWNKTPLGKVMTEFPWDALIEWGCKLYKDKHFIEQLKILAQKHFINDFQLNSNSNKQVSLVPHVLEVESSYLSTGLEGTYKLIEGHTFNGYPFWKKNDHDHWIYRDTREHWCVNTYAKKQNVSIPKAFPYKNCTHIKASIFHPNIHGNELPHGLSSSWRIYDGVQYVEDKHFKITVGKLSSLKKKDNYVGEQMNKAGLNGTYLNATAVEHGLDNQLVDKLLISVSRSIKLAQKEFDAKQKGSPYSLLTKSIDYAVTLISKLKPLENMYKSLINSTDWHHAALVSYTMKNELKVILHHAGEVVPEIDEVISKLGFETEHVYPFHAYMPDLSTIFQALESLTCSTKVEVETEDETTVPVAQNAVLSYALRHMSFPIKNSELKELFEYHSRIQFLLCSPKQVPRHILNKVFDYVHMRKFPFHTNNKFLNTLYHELSLKLDSCNERLTAVPWAWQCMNCMGLNLYPQSATCTINCWNCQYQVIPTICDTNLTEYQYHVCPDEKKCSWSTYPPNIAVGSTCHMIRKIINENVNPVCPLQNKEELHLQDMNKILKQINYSFSTFPFLINARASIIRNAFPCPLEESDQKTMYENCLFKPPIKIEKKNQDHEINDIRFLLSLLETEIVPCNSETLSLTDSVTFESHGYKITGKVVVIRRLDGTLIHVGDINEVKKSVRNYLIKK